MSPKLPDYRIRRRLRERSRQMVGTLSGGEQQMVAIGRALMTRPKLLILIVAYNAETTIARTLTRIPASLLEDYDVEVLVIDDGSKDRTFDYGESLRRTTRRTRCR